MYNLRKKRAGAFRQDCYHATAVGTGEYLKKCIVYIDLDTVRTGTVNHQYRWLWCGYNEIQKPGRKNILTDFEKLKEVAGFDSFDIFHFRLHMESGSIIHWQIVNAGVKVSDQRVSQQEAIHS